MRSAMPRAASVARCRFIIGGDCARIERKGGVGRDEAREGAPWSRWRGSGGARGQRGRHLRPGAALTFPKAMTSLPSHARWTARNLCLGKGSRKRGRPGGLAPGAASRRLTLDGPRRTACAIDFGTLRLGGRRLQPLVGSPLHKFAASFWTCLLESVRDISQEAVQRTGVLEHLSKVVVDHEGDRIPGHSLGKTVGRRGRIVEPVLAAKVVRR